MISRTVVVVSSPSSGTRHGRIVAGSLVLALEREGHVPIEIVGQSLTETYRDALRSARTADALVVVGGDGTVHLCAKVAIEAGIPMGLVPAGSGNDFARMMEIPRHAERAIGRVIDSLRGPSIRSRPVDIIVTACTPPTEGVEYTVQAVSLGIDAEVNERANSMTMLDGSLRYVVASLREINRYQTWVYDLDVEGVPEADLVGVRSWSGVSIEPDGDAHFRVRGRREGVLLSVANGTSYGGGFVISPSARVDDGYIDFVFADAVGRLKTYGLFARLAAGTHFRNPAVKRLRARRLTVTSPEGEKQFKVYCDGEFCGVGHFEAEVAPKLLNVIA